MSSPVVTESALNRARPRLWTPSAEPPESEAPASETPPAEPPEPEAPPAAGVPPAKKPRPPRRKAKAAAPAPPGPPDARPRYSPTIKELPADQRPRERLHAFGAQALTTAELIAILIRVGTRERSAVSLGEHLLAHFGNIKGVAGASVEELSKIKGVGPAKAAEIKAAIEFGNRLALFTGDVRPAIGGPRDVANLLMPDLRYLKKETLKSILMDTKNRVLAIKTVSIGDLSSSIVHPREVFKDAIVASAASLIVAHNHPSGDPTPSADDVAVTKRLMDAGGIIGIDLLDHIVIGDGKFVSLKERGLI